MPKTEMLINYVPGEECRIAIVEDGKLEEFYQERASSESHVSNIYKGRVTNVEPAIQAAFVDFGLERNGFLHITDLHPKYFPGKDREEFETVGHKTARHDRPPIQKCLKRGQEVLVQVLKEGIGTKGPTITSYLSIPGRFLVMMPDMTRLGVSRKVEDDEARAEMRDILKALNPPKEFGFIVRTAGIGQTKTDLKRDLAYLQRLWKDIDRKRRETRRVGELYAESDLVIRTIRDVFNNDIDRIVCDDLTAARRAQGFLSVANPRSKSQVVYYHDPVPLFHRMGVEEQLDHMNAREVPLPSGGALVIDQAEALVAIDVNSGKSRAARDAETNAYQTNLEAVDEIARQLRLRDLGGLVVLDLIDMRSLKNRKTVETQFRNNLKKDRARTRVGPISQFGLLEMTRQRMRPSLVKSIYRECDHCVGRGYSMSPESVVLSVMRRLALVMQRQDVVRVELTISPDVAFHILNRKRSELVTLEQTHNKTVMVRVGGSTVDFVNVVGFNSGGISLPDELDKRKLRPPTDESFRELDASDLPPLDVGLMDPDDDDDDQARTAEPEATAPAAPAGSSPATEDRAEANAADGGEDADPEETGGRRRRRRRGGRGRKRGGAEGDALPPESDAGEWTRPAKADAEQTDAEEPAATADPSESGGSVESETDQDAASASDAGDDHAPQKKKRRRRRRGRGRSGEHDAEDVTSPVVGDSHAPAPTAAEDDDDDDDDDDDSAEPTEEPVRASFTSPRPIDGPDQGYAAESDHVAPQIRRPSAASTDDESADRADATEQQASPDGKKKRRRRRGRGKGTDDSAAPTAAAAPAPRAAAPRPAAPPVKKSSGANKPLPRDQFGDVDGNTKPEFRQGPAGPSDAAGHLASPPPGDAAAPPPTGPRPPLKPGRGYANRMINR